MHILNHMPTKSTLRRVLKQSIFGSRVQVQIAYEDRLVERISSNKYDSIRMEWEVEQKSIMTQLKRLSADKSVYYDAGMALHRLATHAREIYLSKKVTDEDRRLLMSYVFKEVKISQGKIFPAYTKAFEFLMNWGPSTNQCFEQTKNGSNSEPFLVNFPQTVGMLEWRDAFRAFDWGSVHPNPEYHLEKINSLMALVK